MTLAHFGIDRQGGILHDAELPASLTADWRSLEDNQDKPFPSFPRLLVQHDTPEADSDFS